MVPSIIRLLLRCPACRTISPFGTARIPIRTLRRVHSTRPLRSPDVNPGQDGADTNTKGSKLRALVAFGIGIPLGWTIHHYTKDKNNATAARPHDFIRYRLVKRQDVSSTSSIFTLAPAGSSIIDVADASYERALLSIQFKQPQIQIARSYTLLPPLPEQDPLEMRFLIRKEPRGEMSGYIHRLALGAEVEVRGPDVECVLPADVGQVLFLAGGTGIAPSLQVADKVNDRTAIQILWANRCREECVGAVSDTAASAGASVWNLWGFWTPFGLPLSSHGQSDQAESIKEVSIVSELNRMKAQRVGLEAESDKLTVDYFVDEEGMRINSATVSKALGQLNKQNIEPGDRLLFVSGPDGFVSHWAGPKLWVNGRETQGPLGGVLSTLDLRGWQVVKL